MRDDAGRRERADAEADLVGISELAIARQALRERCIVPEIRIAAADARRAGLNRIAHALEPAQVAAAVVRLRPAAAELVEAPARFRARVVKVLGEHARIKERTAVARVVDAVAVELLRTALAIERRQVAEQSDMHDDARHDLRNRRAARHIDDRRVADERADARRTRRVRLRALDAARDSAGAVGDDGLCTGRCLLQHPRERTAARHAVDAVVLRRDSALDGQDVVSLVLFHDLFEVRLERLARSRAEQMVILEIDLAEHDIRCERCARADERLIAARALVAVNPDDDWQRLRLGRLDDLLELVRAQTHHRRERNAPLEEAPAAHALPQIPLPKTFPFFHVGPSSVRNAIPRQTCANHRKKLTLSQIGCSFIIRQFAQKCHYRKSIRP